MNRPTIFDYGASIEAYEGHGADARFLGQAVKSQKGDMWTGWSVRVGTERTMRSTKTEARRELLRLLAPTCRCGSGEDLCPDGLCPDCSIATVRIELVDGSARGDGLR